MMVFPAIKQGAANRNPCQYGKFQGMIEPITPSGSKVMKLFLASVLRISSERKLLA